MLFEWTILYAVKACGEGLMPLVCLDIAYVYSVLGVWTKIIGLSFRRTRHYIRLRVFIHDRRSVYEDICIYVYV